jgi:hypothetical protein
MTKRALVISFLLISSLVSGCREAVSPKPTQIRQQGRIEVDDGIFDTVLSDLLRYEDFTPAVGELRGKSQIVLSERTYGGLSNGFLENGCSNPIKEVPSEIRVDLIRRNPKGMRWPLTHYRPTNPDIVVRHLSQADPESEFKEVFPDARGYVETYLPGYSSDRQTALIAFRFGPTAHDAVGYYLLKNVEGRWEIIWRSLSYFD